MATKGIAAFLFVVGLLGPAHAGEADVPLREVVLFTSGVGYFQRDGQVDGDALLELKFDTNDINDLLKSVVLRDFDGGKVASVTYDNRDPITRALKSFAIDLTSEPSVADILRQVRGEQIEVAVPGPLAGVIVGIETRNVAVGDTVMPTEVLNLLTTEGLKSVPLDQVQQIRFKTAELDRDFRQALAVLAAGHDTGKKRVQIRFRGQGKRRVRIGYIAETPLWKTSYRLVLGETERPALQGWAIVENTSDADWKDLRLTLVSGRPLSFVMDLYQPLYVPRPEVKPELHATVKPRKYAEAMDKLAEKKDARPQARRGRLRSKSKGLAAGVPAAAEAAAVGELFQYAIATPVTLPRQKSALLPIVNAAIDGKKVSIYNERVHAKHPLNGLRLTNTTGLHLMQGPITVFDEGVYAGDAQIDDLAPKGKRLLSYAMDLDTEVEPVTRSRPALLVSARLARGTLFAMRQLRREKTYNVKNRGRKERALLIEHPFEADWTLVEPKAAERTREVYRFALSVDAGGAASVRVIEERQLEQSVILSRVSGAAIEIYLRAPSVSRAVKEALGKVVSMKTELAKTVADLRREERRATEIEREQKRIRENMARLPQNSPLYARYVKTLTTQEDELASIRDRASKLRDQQSSQQEALDRYLLALEVE
ncbi:MAG: hypothetical protein ACYTGZ_01740 [Planctomycetota bacterium]|jgi:hypothetical protein